MTLNVTAKVLIIDDFHPLLQSEFQSHDIQFMYQPDFSLQNDMHLLKSAEVVVVRSKVHFNAELLRQLPNLKCIARGGAGMDNIDEMMAKDLGIHLINAPEGNRDAVAEHCMALLLCLSNNIVKGHNEIRHLDWNREGNRGWEIGGKTIGIIGFGNMGSEFAKRLQGFNCDILVFDKYKQVENQSNIKSASLESICKHADVISFHIPLLNDTNMMLNSGLIDAMKDGVVILNTSRGGIAETAALLNGINSGKIKALGLDVLENENFKHLNEKEKKEIESLLAHNQVVISPHVAGWTVESYKRIAEVLSEKIVDFTTKFKNI